VGEKLKKVETYRSRAAGRRCWLVIYSDGFPPSAWIAPEDVPQMCEVVRECSYGATAQFDRVWWLDLGAGQWQRRLYAIERIDKDLE
jgi:hypothetical protein